MTKDTVVPVPLRSGVSSIDTAHECLHFLVNRLFEPAVRCDGAAACRRVADLKRFLERNLALEEELMARAGYPDIEAHRRDHARIGDILERRQGAGECCCGGPDGALASALRDWSLSHAGTFDQPFGRFLKAAAADTPAAAHSRHDQRVRRIGRSRMQAPPPSLGGSARIFSPHPPVSG